MNIQIFGIKKSFDSKKAERFFKERGIKYQFVDMKEKGLSKGEFNSVCQAVGGYEKLIDQECKDKDLLKKKGLCILMMKFLFLILFIILEKRTFRAIVALPAGIVTAGYMEEINKDESL